VVLTNLDLNKECITKTLYLNKAVVTLTSLKTKKKVIQKHTKKYTLSL